MKNWMNVLSLGFAVVIANTMLVSSLKAEGDTSTPTFTIIELKRIDMGPVKRLNVYATVGEGLSTGSVARVVSAIVEPRRSMHAISVFVLRDGESVGAYSVAMGEWAPGGVWANAIDGLKDSERKNYCTKMYYSPLYFSEVEIRTAVRIWILLKVAECRVVHGRH